MGIGLALLLALAGSVQASSPVVDLAQNQQDNVFLGPKTNSYLSEVFAQADFNGDGYKDILLGAPGYDPSSNGSAPNQGTAYMILGGPNPPGTFNLANTQANFTIYGREYGNAMGHSVAGGDVDGDGIADLVIAADGNSSYTGAVYVIFGGRDRFAAPWVIDLAAGNKQPDVTINGGGQNDRLGRSVTVGDVNGDGIADIVMGSYLASPGKRTEAGVVYVLLGRPRSQWKSTIDLRDGDANLTIEGAAGLNSAALSALSAGQPDQWSLFADEVRSPVAGLGDRLGRSVALGDINGDGLLDVIAGAYGADVGPAVDAGKTYVFYGKTAYQVDTHTDINLNTNPGLASITLSGIDEGDQSGFNVKSGDLNRDGKSDILIGAYLSAGSGNSTGAETGEVYAVYGGASLSFTINLANANLVIYGAAAGDRLGRSLAAGDVNGDGYDDWVLGASRASPNGRSKAGEVFVIYGGPNIPSPILLSSPNSSNIQILGASSGTQPGCEPPIAAGTDCSDEVGHTLAVADLNRDNAADILTGAIFANNGSTLDAGNIYVINGSLASSVAITPTVSSVKAGKPISFTMTGTNKFGSWDVTTSSLYSIQAQAGGSWNGNVYTASSHSGTWKVTGNYQGMNAFAQLTIEHGTPVGLKLWPESAGIFAGDEIVFTAFAIDDQGNTWDVNPDSAFSISNGAGGSWKNNIYTSQNTGTWTVNVTYQSFSASSSLTVSPHNPAVSLRLTPQQGRVVAGQSIAFTATATDASGYFWDVSQTTKFSLDNSSAGGSWDGNIYTSWRQGSYVVTGIYQGLSATANLMVYRPGDPVAITITPKSRLAEVGETVKFTVLAVDDKNITWDVSADARCSTPAEAGGSWSGTVYTLGKAGNWTVTCTYLSFTDKASLLALNYVNRGYLPINAR
ncbi:MAG TPA: FG-GAP repeat protein [Anaerolineales bacterium]